MTGPAHVLTSLEGIERFKAGEILVAPFTDPGWTPLFSLATAVITENGGLLSHAALIAREYNLPAVLNVKNITKLVRTGQTLEVNGQTGTVRILSGDHAVH